MLLVDVVAILPLGFATYICLAGVIAMLLYMADGDVVTIRLVF